MEINVSDDVIKSMTKEEAIKAIGEYLDTADDAGHVFPIKFLNALDMAMSALSADVRPNIHARWESDGYGHIFCTACKGAKLNTHRSKFCDSCGAIMDAKVEPNKKGDK